MNTRLDEGIIVRTDARCVIKRRAFPGIPTLIWSDGIDRDASDWFRALVVKYHVQAASVYEYAKAIRPFFRYCRQKKRSWQSVDDEFLSDWRDQRVSAGIGHARVNVCLQVIFAFYKWAQRDGRIRWRVGVYRALDLP